MPMNSAPERLAGNVGVEVVATIQQCTVIQDARMSSLGRRLTGHSCAHIDY